METILQRTLTGTLTGTQAEKFELYAALLKEWDAKFNLTAVAPADYFERHFADSLAALAHFNFERKSVIDVGSGAGFPGVPLKLAVPTLELTLIEAEEKRCAFLFELCAKLGLEAVLGTGQTVGRSAGQAVRIIHRRAEELGRERELRGAFDAAVSRAVAPLTALCELCLPFVGDEGTFIAWKSASVSEEAAAASDIIQKLGAEYLGIREYQNSGALRSLALYRKLGDTPAKYPRRWAKIQRSC